jgi:hypothetical protein
MIAVQHTPSAPLLPLPPSEPHALHPTPSPITNAPIPSTGASSGPPNQTGGKQWEYVQNWTKKAVEKYDMLIMLDTYSYSVWAPFNATRPPADKGGRQVITSEELQWLAKEVLWNQSDIVMMLFSDDVSRW